MAARLRPSAPGPRLSQPSAAPPEIAEQSSAMKTYIILNPAAGRGAAGQRRGDLEAALRAVGLDHTLVTTHARGGATELTYQALEQGYDCVVAVGGDGTINEVVNGLAGTATALAPLPLGTMNVWARELRLPLQPRAAAEALLDWRPRRIDLGKAGERYFLLMAGIGFDAAITAGIRPDEKRRLGALAYVLRGVGQAFSFRGARMRLILDGRPTRGRVLMVVVGNTQLYGGLVKITHRASIDDGMLDVAVFKGDNGLSAVRRMIAILRRSYSRDPEIAYYRARTVQVIARPRLPVQVDGDPIGETPMTFEVAPGALQALLPVDLPEDLVQQPALAASPKRTFPRLMGWLSRR